MTVLLQLLLNAFKKTLGLATGVHRRLSHQPINHFALNTRCPRRLTAEQQRKCSSKEVGC